MGIFQKMYLGIFQTKHVIYLYICEIFGLKCEFFLTC